VGRQQPFEQFVAGAMLADISDVVAARKQAEIDSGHPV